jgi:hypothetical protein
MVATLKCDTIVNASSGTNNLALDASGNVTVGAGLTLTGGALTVGGSVGSAGQILKSNGTTSSWVNGWTLINSISGTNAAALQDTTSLTSTYANYMIFIRNLIPITSAVTLQFQIYSGGAYQTSGYLGTGDIGNLTNYSSTTNILLTRPLYAGTTYSLTGVLYLSNPSSTTLYKPISGIATYGDTAANPAVQAFWTGGAFTTNTAAITGFQISATSGNVTGSVQIYGAN